MADSWESLENDPRQVEWSSWPGAVLLDDEIRYYASHPDYPLITPFDEANLKPARYQLTLGPEARVGGKTMPIDEKNPLVIPPHQVAIVRTMETINLPRFIIARWNLTVDMVYRGLLWVGALQVDPGWVGYLPCPLYNMSNEEVKINAGDKLFTIDFVKTTKFGDKNKRYPNKSPLPPLNPPIHHYDPHNLRSGPYELIEQVARTEKIAKDTSKSVELANTRIATFVVIIVAVIGIMVSALALMVGAQSFEFTLSIPIVVSLILSVLAITIALVPPVKALFRRRKT